MLILEGVPGGGKSILSKILQSCVGSQYHSAVSIAGLAGPFGLGTLPGVKLAVMSEARTIDFAVLKAIVPILLKVTGQDYVDSTRKGVDAHTELLECKLLMLTNRTPVLPDDTGALSQRIMMIRFNKTFRGTSEDVLGLDRLIIKEGLASIIRWHLEGLERLSERKYFNEPEIGVQAKQNLEDQIDPLRTFIKKYFKICFNGVTTEYIPQKDFTLYFRAYCKRLGQPTKDTIVQKRASIRSIKTLVPKAYIKRFRTTDSVVPRIIGLFPVINLALEFSDELYDLQ